MNASRPIPIIMAGGIGARLWPLSRDTLPKQFIPLLDPNRSPFQDALLRLGGEDFARPLVVTNHDFRFLVAEQMQAIGVEGDIVLEPIRRDSAAAIAVGALLAAKRDPEAICIAAASDHIIKNSDAFRADCLTAASLATDGLIMTLGIPASSPSTAYGYIEPGDRLSHHEAFTVKRFIEKPDAQRARAFVDAGMVWNSGSFVFAAGQMIEELSCLAPETLKAARAAIEDGVRDLDFFRLDLAAFTAAPSISIDYAVMEKVTSVGMIRAGFDWSDIGTWDSIHSVARQDGHRNAFEGHVYAIDTTDTLVHSSDILTAVVGLQNMIVVTTRDAVLVASAACTGKVKQLVEKLKRENRPEGSEHLRGYRPWGWYQRIDLGTRFQVKHICVKPGGRLSLQKHFHRAEHWVVVSGTAEVTVDGRQSYVHENEAVYLPIGCTHRLCNPGKIPLELIEVQVGSYTGEDDIVRIEDIYARC